MIIIIFNFLWLLASCNFSTSPSSSRNWTLNPKQESNNPRVNDQNAGEATNEMTKKKSDREDIEEIEDLNKNFSRSEYGDSDERKAEEEKTNPNDKIEYTNVDGLDVKVLSPNISTDIYEQTNRIKFQEGLYMGVVCRNTKCGSNKKLEWVYMGIDNFNFGEIIFKQLKCNNCNEIIMDQDILEIGFNNCLYKIQLFALCDQEGLPKRENLQKIEIKNDCPKTDVFYSYKLNKFPSISSMTIKVTKLEAGL